MTIELYKNSFVTLEEAENYFDERYDSNEWFELQESDKEKLLISSSKKVNSFDFSGSKADENQPMNFPRDYGTPQDIKDAVCEEALTMVKKSDNIHIQNQNNNITSISLGAGSVSYATAGLSDEAKIILSPIASNLIKKWTKKGYYIPF